jgi:hypothetical protein
VNVLLLLFLFIAIDAIDAIDALAHVGPLDAYGCHSDKARFGNTSSRECHADLLAGKTFPSLQAELTAYISALRTQHSALQSDYSALSTQHSALKDELFVVKGELELARIKLGGLADATIYSCAITERGSQ